MIYINYTEKTQEVYVPRNGWTPEQGDEVVLKAVSTSDNTTAIFVVHDWSVKGIYLCLVAGIPEELFVGEWDYFLLIAGEIRSVGVMQVTDDTDAGTQYNKEITYKQYGE